MADFEKYQALGNDYIVIDPNSVDLVPTAESVRRLCDRHFGIGGDGVLFGPLWIHRSEQGASVGLRIFNSDGSECERSGNGLRMFALYAADNYGLGPAFSVRTAAGPSPVEIVDRQLSVIRVAMGLPSFDAADVPVLGISGPALEWPLSAGGRTLTLTSVNVGNPHTVVPLDHVSRETALELGPEIARHPRFPNGTNVQFMQVLGRHAIRLEIWERGSGYTLASGSSSCAAAAAARALDLIDDEVRVTMPGGELDISFSADGSISMTGVAEAVTAGSFAPAFRERLGLPRTAISTAPCTGRRPTGQAPSLAATKVRPTSAPVLP